MAAEGSFFIVNNGHYGLSAKAEVSNTDRNLLRKLRAECGGKIYCGVKPKSKQWKGLFHWRINRLRELLDFLNVIIPYLPSKQRQAILLKQFCESRLSYNGGSRTTHVYNKHEKAILSQIHALNKRGLN